MKKIAVAAACMATIITANSMYIFADNSPGNKSDLASKTNKLQTTSTNQAGIAPDSPLYVFDKIIESIQITLTFPSEEKAELLISFANERLAEASILNEKSKMELIEDIMKAYMDVVEKANEQIKEAAEEGKDVKPIIQEIKLVQDTADTITISIEGGVRPESAEQLKTEIVNVVKETLAVEAFATAKENFFEAKKQFELAKEELKRAMESKDSALIEAARNKLALAEKNKSDLELIKDQIEIKKEAVKKEIEIDNKEIEEKDKDSEKAEDKIEKKVEKIEEKAEKKAEKAMEKAEKEAEKAREKIKKVNEKSKVNVHKDEEDKD